MKTTDFITKRKPVAEATQVNTTVAPVTVEDITFPAFDATIAESKYVSEISRGNYYDKAHKSKIQNMAKTMFADPNDPEVQAAARNIKNREAGMQRSADRGRKELAAKQLAAKQATVAADAAKLPELKSLLAAAEDQFDPQYERSDVHSYWLKQKQLAGRIGELRQRIAAAEQSAGQSQLKENASGGATGASSVAVSMSGGNTSMTQSGNFPKEMVDRQKTYSKFKGLKPVKAVK
jgi:hypothetical protein